jgi:RNA polymerase sigma factor (sigma-70 family)
MREMVSLIAGCVEDRDKSAREEFVSRFQRVIASTVIKTCSRYGIMQQAQVDDLIQDIYVRIFDDRCRTLRQLRTIDEVTIYGFVQSVAFSTVIDHVRGHFAKKRGGGSIPVDFDLAAATAASRHPAREYEDALLLQKIDLLLEEIAAPPHAKRDRRIFQLYLDGYTAKTIADMEGIGLSDKGVESVYQRLKAEIRVRLLTQAVETPCAKRRGA